MLNEISSEFEKVREKHHSTNNTISKLISDLKDTLTEYESALATIPADTPQEKQSEAFMPFLDTCNSKITKLDVNKYYNNTCNTFYGSLSKLGKIMLKDFERENIDDFELYAYNKKLFYTVSPSYLIIIHRSLQKTYIAEETLTPQIPLSRKPISHLIKTLDLTSKTSI